MQQNRETLGRVSQALRRKLMLGEPNYSSVDVLRGLVAPCSVVLLDLNDTFAFGCDRLDSGQDFPETYRRLGGRDLHPAAVQNLVNAACTRLFEIGRDPTRNESFPTVSTVLSSIERGGALGSSEVERLAAVVGAHEVGAVPEPYAVAVKKLARRFRLGLVSNIWASSGFFVTCLRDAGLGDCFESLVFSSDHGVTKPSASIFRIALNEMGVEASDTVYVGNSLRRDVAGARNSGIPAIWVKAEGDPVSVNHSPDGVVPDFIDFVDAVT